MNPIIAFFTNTGTDHKGRSIEYYLNANDIWLETCHDYIQWAFPTRTPSKFNENAPLLNDKIISNLKDNCHAITNYKMFLHRMLAWLDRHEHWLVPTDHNHLRITRMIDSVREILGQDESYFIYYYVVKMNNRAGCPVNHESIRFWQKAATGAGE